MDQAHAPTKERLTHGTVEPGFLQRQAYRSIPPYETLKRREDIDEHQANAAAKFFKHYMGMQGVDVRNGDTVNPDPIEYPRHYHAEKIMKANRAIANPQLYEAVIWFVVEERSLEDIGRNCRNAARREIARATGLALIFTALNTLAYHWGFKPMPSSNV